jgi:hypothetical protein
VGRRHHRSSTTATFAITPEYNHPSPAAPEGGGYRVDVRVGGCTVISYVEPGGSPVGPLEELRGRVRLCSDCL